MISKTKISKRIKKKTDPNLVETLMLAKKSDNIELAHLLSSPTRKRVNKNLDEINKESKEGDIIIIPGKVLGEGEIDKKIKIIALNFSSSALEKLKKAKVQIVTIKEELEKNKEIKGKVLR